MPDDRPLAGWCPQPASAGLGLRMGGGSSRQIQALRLDKGGSSTICSTGPSREHVYRHLRERWAHEDRLPVFGCSGTVRGPFIHGNMYTGTCGERWAHEDRLPLFGCAGTVRGPRSTLRRHSRSHSLQKVGDEAGGNCRSVGTMAMVVSVLLLSWSSPGLD